MLDKRLHPTGKAALVALVLACAFGAPCFAAEPPPATPLPDAGPSAIQPPAATPPAVPQPGFGAALGELGLYLLRAAPEKAGAAEANVLVSPFSIANALGMLHAGAQGQTAAEIARLLEPATARGRLFVPQMSSLNQVLRAPAAGIELTSANRIWIEQTVAQQVNKSFTSRVAEAFFGDGVTINFAEPSAAAGKINEWVSQATQGHIARLLTADALPTSTHMVVTNAVYFKGAWAQPFNPAATHELPFSLKPGQTVPVPTMSGTMAIREATVGAANVLELPYGEGEFALVIAMPASAEQALSAVEQDVTGADLIGWLPLLKAVTVTVQLPKFRILPTAMPLKEPLIAAGMAAPFSAGANFEPMVGKANLVLDNVIHAAGVIVDEEGSVATAATAGVVRSKSIGAGPPLRKIDRPFLFAIVHKPSATPLFVGRLSNPARD